jgi:hypothetical protein
MPVAQIIAVTTREFGPSGPVKRLFAVGSVTPDVALDLVQRRLKAGETAKWLDARALTIGENEVRPL